MTPISDERLKKCPFCKGNNLSAKLTPNGYEWCEDCKMPFRDFADGFVSIRIKDFETAYVSRLSFDVLAGKTTNNLGDITNKISDERLQELIQAYRDDEMGGAGNDWDRDICSAIIELQTSRQTIKRLMDNAKEMVNKVGHNFATCAIWDNDGDISQCTCGSREMIGRHLALMSELKEQK